MFLEATVLSLILAKIRGGRFKNLEKVYIKGWYLFIISALIQGLLSVGKKMDIPMANKILGDYLLYVMIFTYILMMVPLILNIEKKYMKLLFIGLALNLMVIAANQGRMPVSLNGIEGIKKGINNEISLPQRDFDIKHETVDKNTKLVYLADIILIPEPYPLAKILSIGDIFLILGAFQFFQEEMVVADKKKYRSQNTY